MAPAHENDPVSLSVPCSTVAPPLQFPVPLQLIYGDADEVVDSQEIRHWSEGVQSRKSVHCLSGAGHFFHGRLTELKEILQQTAPS